MTGLARQHALETCAQLRLPADKILAAYEIVESVLGAEWLAEQERQSEKHRLKISDAHPLVRILAEPTPQAHAEICELALYLQQFASDPSIGSIIQDLRTPKYPAILMELAFAHRWQDAGAKVRLRPTTARGEADFEAILSELPFVVETSLFPEQLFREPRFRLPQIIAQAVEKSALPCPIKLSVMLREYPAGNVEAQVFAAITAACRQFASQTTPLSQWLPFGNIDLQALNPEPDYNPFLQAAEEEPWDICFRHVKRHLPYGEPIYNATGHDVAEEQARIFVKFPPNDVDIYNAIYRKLKKEAAQLSGVKGPRVVILDTGALGDISGYNEDALRSQLRRLMRPIPELACVWLSMRRFLRECRHRYFSLYVPNQDSTYQMPSTFVDRYAMREWRWDYLAGEEFSDER